MPNSSTSGAPAPPRESDVARVRRFFDENPSVNFVRFMFMDFGSGLRLMVIPKTSAIEAADRGFILGPYSPLTCEGSAGGIILDHMEAGSDEMRPDWRSMRTCTYYPGHAALMCFIHQPQPGKLKSGYALDPRTILMDQIASTAKDGIDLLIGLEIEFLITDPATDFSKRPPKTSSALTEAMHNDFAPVVDEIVLAIEKAEFKVTKYHPEEGVLGFFEIVLAPLSPLHAADAMIYCHETIKTLCQKKGLKATLTPRPFETRASIGSHINISISKPDEGNSESFLAGLLSHLRAICAFTMSNYESYSRSRGLGEWVQWGDCVKSAVIHQRRKGLWEIRCADATMNPYLAFAAIIVAGMHGLRTKQELTIKGMTQGPPLTEDQRKEANITEKLPSSLSDALAVIRDDELLNDDDAGLGSYMLKYYIGLKKHELEHYGGMMDLERRIAIMRVF